MPPSPTSTRPLWQRLLIRRLKFFGWLGALFAITFGGSYLLAPQWLLDLDLSRQELAARVDKQTITLGDTTWSYYTGGDGPNIVLIHGFAADKTEWLDLAAQLTKNFHVIIPDLPGWGASTRVDGADYSIEAQAARLRDFMAAMRSTAFVLVGHGTGAAVAARYAAEHPEAVRELALLDAYGLEATHSVFAGADAARTVFAYDDRAAYARAQAWLYLKPPAVWGRFVDVRIARNQAERAFLERRLEDLRRPAEQLIVQRGLGELVMPVMGLWCRDDRVIDRSGLDSLRNGLKHASAISSSLLGGCGHLPMREKAAETAQILTGFALSH